MDCINLLIKCKSCSGCFDKLDVALLWVNQYKNLRTCDWFLLSLLWFLISRFKKIGFNHLYIVIEWSSTMLSCISLWITYYNQSWRVLYIVSNSIHISAKFPVFQSTVMIFWSVALHFIVNCLMKAAYYSYFRLIASILSNSNCILNLWLIWFNTKGF